MLLRKSLYPLNNLRKHCQSLSIKTNSNSSMNKIPMIVNSRHRLSCRKKSHQLNVVGYSTNNEYNIINLEMQFEDEGPYKIYPLDDELKSLCLHIKPLFKNAKGDQDIYIFENGSVVFWNVSKKDIYKVLKTLKNKQGIGGYDESVVQEESENMYYSFENINSSRLFKGEIQLSQANNSLDKYSFSDAISASVKLGILESSLDRVISSIEHLSEDLKNGNQVKLSREDVMKKTGEIFEIRHILNLSSDLLDVPDFYWDREDLEKLYTSTCSYLAINKRTSVMNEKLNHCNELLNLISNHLSDKHHVRLEWFIIILIMIEVGFEILHFIENYLYQ